MKRIIEPPVPDWDKIPDAMKQETRWLLWRSIRVFNEKTGKWKNDKVPFSHRTGHRVDPGDSSHWLSFEEAQKLCKEGSYGGIGFALGDGWAGIDMDSCFDPEGRLGWGETKPGINLSPELAPDRIIETFEDEAYFERSPSGNGLHGIMRLKGKLPPRRRKLSLSASDAGGKELACYDSGRFFTVTGRKIAGNCTMADATDKLVRLHSLMFPQASVPIRSPQAGSTVPVPALEDGDIIERASHAKDGDKFQRLWEGDHTGYPSQSEADLALMNKLAFWSGKRPDQMERVFQRSGLYRETGKGKDYLSRTIKNACEFTVDTYSPHKPQTGIDPHRNGATVPAIREAEPLAVVNARNGSGAAVVLQEPDLDSTAEPPLDALVEQGDAIEPVKPDPLPEQPQPSKKKSKKTAQSANDEPKKDSQATKLIRMINEVAFSHTPEGALFASFSINNHHETHSIRSKAFRIYMQRRYHDETGSALGKNGLSDALGVFEGRAVYDGPEKEVFCRIAQHGDAIYIDLGDPEWRAIEVTREGWCVVSEYPVNFRRAKGMLELPVPIENDPDAERHFRECINVQTDDDFALVKAWVLGALRPTGPYPVIWLKGPQGSAKTTTSKVLRQLLDPNQAAMRPLPKEERDFMIAASNSRLLALDNMSHLPDWASDSLCRITTGAGFATREMYSDTEETLFNVICPVIINGIDEVMTRGDLIDRTLVVELAEIPKDSRLTEKEFWSLFEQYRPGILGYFLNALQAAMSNLDSVKLDRLPRMADFALFVTAAEESFGWKPGYFLEIYDRNRAEANSIVLDSSPVAQKLRTFVDKLTDGTYQRLYLLEGKWEPEAGNSDVSTWTGPAAALLRNLNKLTNDEERKPKSWPKEARSLSVALRRLVANLKADGLIVHFCRESKARDIQISRTSSVSHTTEIGDANDDAK